MNVEKITILNESSERPIIQNLHNDNSLQKNHFTFIDLFAGIGGFRIAMQNLGGRCVFSSEIDKHARVVYKNNFGDYPYGDITLPETKEKIPFHFDVLCAGFPCQPFSISGKQKGFEDTRGTLFFDIAEIIKKHRPSIVLLENVKNLTSHDKGNTLKVIIDTLKNRLGYKTFYKILNASAFGLPQNRERIYIVAIEKNMNDDFYFPSPPDIKKSLSEFLELNPVSSYIERSDVDIYKQININNFSLPNRPIQIGKVNKGGQGERIYHPLGHAVTLSANGGGVGAKTGLYFIDGKIRRLTPRECARVQGFPEDFILHSSQNICYKQFGNSVAVDVVEAIGKNFLMCLKNEK